MIRLKDGETNILAGLISDQERRSLSGLPGLASLPFLGRLFARNKDEDQETDIVMTLTPHIVRRPELKEEDLRSFQVGADLAAAVRGADRSAAAAADADRARRPADRADPPAGAGAHAGAFGPRALG